MIVFLDTNIVIYAIESHALFGAPAQSRLGAAWPAPCAVRLLAPYNSR